MSAPAIEQVIVALVERLEAVQPSLRTNVPFRRSSEILSDSETPATACTRRFNVDVLSGQDDSQEGAGVQNAGVADRRVQVAVRVAYERGRKEKALEDLIASDAEWAMRALARSADWSGSPVQRATCRWNVDRSDTQKLFLVLNLEVRYRDTEA
jgi:hypothetical protein